MHTLHDYLNALKTGGYRITDQRRAVCDFLAATPTHPTPSDVYGALSATHPEISRATVYNTLNALRDLGAIVEISVGGDHTHYDTNPEPHVNLVCLRCGQVVDYAGDVPLAVLYETVHAQTGFQAVSAQVQMVGFCAECQTRKRDEIRRQLQASATI
ncbi:MAG: transcriptional repressor [Caldilineaceae bacterium]|nr:transcriptional repressor [Caldilineaceae bacterium]HRJ42788.1 Fur family transcriptional regulator [Caldilineaceae bacterium]